MAPTLRLVIGGGGTGGHTQPAYAVLEALQEHTTLEVFWIGSRTGVERKLAQRAHIPYYWIPTGKLRREWTPRTLLDLIAVPLGTTAAAILLHRLKPHVVFGTGGFVSVPVVLAAYLNRVPILIHEQTPVAGLATRINARFADVIALSYEGTRRRLRGSRGKIVHTGLPVRREVLRGDATAARRRFGLPTNLPLVYVTGGVLGAQAINRALAEILPELLRFTSLVHQCGPRHINGDYPKLRALRATLPSELQQRYVVAEFLEDELADVLAAADLIISRAGASTVAELAALGKPAILIPLPGTRGDEQMANARLLAAAGSAVILLQSELSSTRLLNMIRSLLGNLEELRQRGARGKTLYVPDAAERLATLLLSLSAPRSHVSPVSPVPPVH